jgi:hypothetical protein
LEKIYPINPEGISNLIKDEVNVAFAEDRTLAYIELRITEEDKSGVNVIKVNQIPAYDIREKIRELLRDQNITVTFEVIDGDVKVKARPSLNIKA